MEGSWENWHPHMELDGDEDLLEKWHTDIDDDEEFLRDVLVPVEQQSESDHSSFSFKNTVMDGAGKITKSNSSNSMSSPRTYILSFHDSTMIPVTAEPKLNCSQPQGTPSSNYSSLPSKRTLATQNQGSKKARTRSSSQTMDHIMAERKRRQELTERFIALSATIPGLTKTDKASILRAAIDYVKQLEERVEELEKKEEKRVAESVILIKKSGSEDSSTCSETSCDDCGTFPDIEARVLGKEVLIEIHCEKQHGIELKILDHLENLDLYVTGTSVLPFGNSALGITIIAQMGDAYKMTVNDLVKNLRQVLLKSNMHGLQQ